MTCLLMKGMETVFGPEPEPEPETEPWLAELPWMEIGGSTVSGEKTRGLGGCRRGTVPSDI